MSLWMLKKEGKFPIKVTSESQIKNNNNNNNKVQFFFNLIIIIIIFITFYDLTFNFFNFFGFLR